MNCIICSSPIAEGRVELGYTYCMDKYCVSKALVERRSKVRLIHMPKQGHTYVFADSPDLKYGKSSGRT